MKRLLLTKINRPRRRPGVVARKRLFEKLEEGRWQKLSLVLGPAGSGKSTLVSEWLNDLDVPVAWLSLDEADDDPGRFAIYLVAALSTVAPHVGEGIDAVAVAPGKLNFQAVMERLVIVPLADNAIELVLVLDDFHCIRNKDIYAGIKRLLRHMPEGMHVLIASRVTPNLDLFSLRAKGDLNEVKMADLRFDESEALQFYNQTMGLSLDSEQVRIIERHTEGWAAAMQMAALRLKDGLNPASLAASLIHRRGLASEYLLQEVLDKLEPALRDYLITVSVLERMCDPLCRELIGRVEPPATLGQLDRNNLFLVPLDEEGCWYRLHHLFRNLLRLQLAERTDERVGELHKRASRWFAKADLLPEACEHAAASSDLVFLADLIERNSAQIVSTHGYDALAKWLEVTPDSILEKRPELSLLKAWCTVIEGNTASAEAQIERAQRALDNYHKRQSSDKSALLQHPESEIQAMRAIVHMLRGEDAEALRIAERAFEMLSEDDPLLKRARCRLNLIAGRAQFQLGDLHGAMDRHQSAEQECLVTGAVYGRFQAIYGRSASLIAQGRLNHAYRLCRGALEKARDEQCSLIGPVGNIHYSLSLIHLMRNEPELSVAESERAVEILLLTLDHHTLTWAFVFQYTLTLTYVYQALAKSNLADVEGALAAINEASDLAKTFGNAKLRQWVETYRVAMESRNGIFTHYNSWLNDLADFKPSPVLTDQDINCHRVGLMIAQNETQDALEAIEPSYNFALERNQGLQMIRLEVLKSAALASFGKTKSALVLLEQAIEKAMPEKLRFPFYVTRLRLQPLLADLENQEKREFLASAISEPNGIVPRSPSTHRAGVEFSDDTSSSVEPLSPRELEVLTLIAKGWSNNQIAIELYLALGTVKTHTHNILMKLEAKSRTQAVRIARDMRLFDGGP